MRSGKPAHRPAGLQSVLCLLSLAGALLVTGCFHATRVGEPEKDKVTADPRGNPEVEAQPEQQLVVDSPVKLMRPGAGRKIQQALQKHGLLVRPDSDELGESTMAAIAKAQEEAGLARTGFPDAETLRYLGLDPDEIYREPLNEKQREALLREEKPRAEAAEAAKNPDQEPKDPQAEKPKNPPTPR